MEQQQEPRTLEEAMEMQRRELADTGWKELCPICERFEGGMTELFAHMFARHGLRCGHLSQIVDARGLVRLLHSRVSSLRCICCEGVFPSQPVLHAHMKKRDHRRISALNPAYDRFYLSHYRPPTDVVAIPTSSEQHSEEEDDDDDGDEEEDEEEEETEPTKCLGCETVLGTPREMGVHCKDVHGFVLADVVRQLGIGFYDTLKLINWLREAVTLPSAETIMAMPKPRPWEADRFLLPGSNTDDPLLYSLPDVGCVFPGDTDDDDDAAADVAAAACVGERR